MFVYILIFAFLFILTLCELFYKHSKIFVSYFFVIFSIFVICLIGFRQCGYDYENYYHYFLSLHSEFWRSNAEFLGAELGYAFLNYILGDYRLLLVFMAIASVMLCFTYIYKYSPAAFFSLFLFFCVSFYPSFMGQYRQGLAIAIVLWAFIVKRKSLILFFLLVGLASLFHISSILALIAIVVPSNLLKLRYYIIVLLAAFLFSEFGQVFFFNFLLGGSDFIARKAAIYGKSETAMGLRLGLNLAMLLRVLFFLFFYKYRESILRYPLGSYFLNLYFVGLLIYLGLGFLPQLGGRGSAYFYLFEFILAAMVIKEMPKTQRLLFALAFIGIDLYRYHTFLVASYSDYVPYAWGISYKFN